MSITFAISIKAKKKIGISIFIAIASISIIQYICGIVGILPAGKSITIIASLFSLIYVICHFVKNKNLGAYLKDNYLDILLFSIIYFIAFIILIEKRVIIHNELSLWALLVKDMVHNQCLPTFDNNFLYVGYPPMTRIWDYWFANFFNEFQDGQVYIANAIMQVSLCFAISSLLYKKSKIQNLLVNILIISVMFITNTLFYSTLFVDVTLALLFVFCIVYIYKMEKMDLVDLVIITLALTFLELTKEIGMLFIIIILIYLIIMQREHHKKEIKKILSIVAGILLVISFFKNIWTLYLEINNLNQAWDTTGFNKENIVNFVTGEGKEYQYNALKNFGEEILSGTSLKLFEINISVIAVIIFTTTVMFIMYFVKNDSKILKTICIMLLFDFIFLFCLLCMYLFSFAEWEANTLSAITRYLDIIDIINICLMFSICIDTCKTNVIPIMCLVIIMNTGNARLYTTITSYENNNLKTIERAESYSTIEKYADIFNEKDKIYVIVSDYENPIDREYALLNLRYHIFPTEIYMIDNENISQEKIEEKLRCGYTYVYMYNAKKELLGNYKNLLADKNEEFKHGSLYKIVYEENNNLSLIKVKR